MSIFPWRTAARREEENQEHWDDQLSKAQSGDVEAQENVVANHPERHSLDAIAKIGAEVQERKFKAEYQGWLSRSTEFLKAWLAVKSDGSDTDKIEKLAGLLKCLQLAPRFRKFWDTDHADASTEQLITELQGMVQKRYEQLLGLVREQDQQGGQAFSQLSVLIDDTRGEHKTLITAGVKRLPYPDDWNELVARYVANPGVWDFCIPQSFAEGEMRLLAARALRENDVVNAKIVLAYCKPYGSYSGSWKAWRKELGDMLIADLSKLVDQHNAELRLAEEVKQEV
jgi:hypothetical protein